MLIFLLIAGCSKSKDTVTVDIPGKKAVVNIDNSSQDEWTLFVDKKSNRNLKKKKNKKRVKKINKKLYGNICNNLHSILRFENEESIYI